MPTKREREYYDMGYRDGRINVPPLFERDREYFTGPTIRNPPPQRKRKLSAWQKFVKANSKKPRFRYKSGRKKGMINLKALGVAYRKKKR